MSINTVLFGGNLVRDPESKNGCTYFTVASDSKYTTKDGEKKTESTFMRVLTMGKLGEAVMSYCQKGTQVLVEGRLKVEQDKEKGNRCAVMAKNVHFLNRTKQKNEGGNTHEPVKTGNPIDEIRWEE